LRNPGEIRATTWPYVHQPDIWQETGGPGRRRGQRTHRAPAGGHPRRRTNPFGAPACAPGLANGLEHALGDWKLAKTRRIDRRSPINGTVSAFGAVYQ
jgi:hypothetical protein